MECDAARLVVSGQCRAAVCAAAAGSTGGGADVHAKVPCLRCNASKLCRPLVAVLDECTNATSVEVEEKLFLHAKSLGITIITVTQRPALTKLYKNELKLLDGHGHWEMCELENSSDSA